MQPLSDARVLEFGHVVAAPYASRLLMELGAEVVKVEPPSTGDTMRQSGKAGSAIFNSLNRGKMSVALDLRKDSDHQTALELAQESDIVIENFSPGAMDQLGLSYDTLSKINPRLIYVSINGYSQSGPYSDRSATDPIIEAMCGLMNMTGQPDGEPARAGTSVVDIAGAQYAVIAALSACLEQNERSRGEYIEVPLFESGASLMTYWIAYQQMHDEEPQRMGASHPLFSPYDTYPTRGGDRIFLAATKDSHWNSIKDLLGLELTLDDSEERLKKRAFIDTAISRKTKEWKLRDLEEQLLQAGVPCAPVKDISDVVEDKHLNEVGIFSETDVGGSSTTDTNRIKIPNLIPFLEEQSLPDQEPPDLGEHTQSVLEMNLSVENPTSE